jgi:predicted nucleic acid-binding protein
VKTHETGKLAQSYVLDSFALLGYLTGEPGFEISTAMLQAAQHNQTLVYVSMINFGEVLYITEREYGLRRAQEVLAALDELPLVQLEATRPRVLAAAHLKASHAISYADAFAVAAAQEFAAVVVTGDPEFRCVAHLVQIEWLPIKG